MTSSPQRPRPGRRRPMERLSITMSLLILALALVSCTSAYEVSLVERAEDSDHFKELEARGEIHFDTRAAPLNWLERRQDIFGDGTSSSASESTSTSSSDSHSTSESLSTTTSDSSSTETDTPTSTSSNSSPSVTVITTPLPSPFDTSIGNNFTSSSCPTFFTNFLANSTFRSCTPVSLLLQTSSSFFRAMRSASLLSATLDTACSAPLSVCSPLMSSLAAQLLQDSNCGLDFRAEQPLVLQAYNGLVAYEPVYRATCLKTSEDNGYCFAQAVSTSPNPADIYPYFTAVGLTMPTGSEPSCTPCLKSSMQVFAEYAVRKEQPLATTYLSCAQMVNATCGTGYADVAIKAGSVDTGMENGKQGGQNAGSRTSANWVLVGVAVLIAMA